MHPFFDSFPSSVPKLGILASCPQLYLICDLAWPHSLCFGNIELFIASPSTHIYTYRHTKISCSMSLLRPGIPYSTLLSSFIMLTHSLRVTSGVVFLVNFPQNLNRLRVPSPRTGCTSILKFIILFWRLSLCVCLSHKPMIYPKTGIVSYSSSYPSFKYSSCQYTSVVPKPHLILCILVLYNTLHMVSKIFFPCLIQRYIFSI